MTSATRAVVVSLLLLCSAGCVTASRQSAANSIIRTAALSRDAAAGNILNQTGAQFPKTWGTNDGKPVPAHYAMTTASETNAVSREAVAAGLKAIPSLSITADPDDLFSSEKGIYSHPQEHGDAWERPVSVEMFDAHGRSTFRCGSGLRIHGGMSRRPEESPKHSFRLVFHDHHQFEKVAAEVTRRKIFHTPRNPPPHARLARAPSRRVGGYDSLILRAGNNDSWLDSDGRFRPRATYIRDEWMRRSMADMGHPSARGVFVHLYLNGLYWGVYNLCEQPGPALLAGEQTAAGFDIRKGDQMESGDEVAWNKMMSLVNSSAGDERSYQEIGRYLDLPELADYLILNFYAGNSDWDRSANWFALRPRTPGGRFQFTVWDAERTLGATDVATLDFDDDDSPPRLFQKLSENPAFRKLFAARAQRLLFDDGPLSPEKSAARFRALADALAPALTAETARWGNYRRDVHRYKTGPFESCTVEHDWQPEVDHILTEYFPRRREVLLNQFRERGLFSPTN